MTGRETGNFRGTFAGCSRSILIFVLLLCLLILPGCTSFDYFRSEVLGQGEDADTTVIRIGVFEPMTGEFAEQGALEIAGIELAWEKYPEIWGLPVELVYADNRSSVESAKDAAQELVDADVDAVLGSYGNTLSLAGGEIFKEAEIPAISITCANPLVSGGNEYYFSISFPESQQGEGAAHYVFEDLGKTNAVLFMSANDDFATAVGQVFSDTLSLLTGSEYAVIRNITYPKGTTDFTNYLNQIVSAGVEAVYLPCSAGDAAMILAQAKAMDLKVSFIGTDRWEEGDLAALAPEAADNVVFTSHYAESTLLTERTVEFRRAYREKYGEEKAPAEAEALAFDAYLLVLDAIERTNGVATGALLQKTLSHTDGFHGAAGIVTLDETGSPTRAILIKKVKNGQYVFIDEQSIEKTPDGGFSADGGESEEN